MSVHSGCGSRRIGSSTESTTRRAAAWFASRLRPAFSVSCLRPRANSCRSGLIIFCLAALCQKPDLGSGLPELWTITTFTHQFEFTNADLQGRSWRMRQRRELPDPRPVLTCSLCGKSQHDVSDLDGGPAAFVREFICDNWLELAKLENPIPALSQSLDDSLRGVVVLAGRLSDEGVTPEYLLLALTDDPDAVPVMQARDVDPEKLRGAVFASMSAPDGGRPPDGAVPRTSQSFQTDIQRAAVHAQSIGREEINGADVLVAVFGRSGRRIFARARHDPV